MSELILLLLPLLAGQSQAAQVPAQVELRAELRGNENRAVVLGTTARTNLHFLLFSTRDGLKVYQDWCSWGWSSRSFVIRDPRNPGAAVHVRHRPGEWTKNFPSTQTIGSGQFLITDIDLCDGTWQADPVPPRLPAAGLELRGSFEIEPDEEAVRQQVWTGRIETPPVEIALDTSCLLALAVDGGGGSPALRMLRSLDGLEQPALMDRLSLADEERGILLGTLLRELGTSRSAQVMVGAIYLIGAHRLEQGVHDLFQHLDFDAGEPGRPTRRERLWDRYPAMEALIKLGRPAVRGAVELLAAEDHDLRRDLAVKVIRYATDAACARQMLERAFEAERSSARKARLRDALSRLARLPG